MLGCKDQTPPPHVTPSAVLLPSVCSVGVDEAGVGRSAATVSVRTARGAAEAPSPWQEAGCEEEPARSEA